MNQSSNSTSVYVHPSDLQFGPTSKEALFFRLASAVEAVVFYAVICSVFPNIYRRWKRCCFYPRLCITYVLILLIIIIRFYDFMESNIFRTMAKGDKIRFLLYGLATLEAMFDLSLVALGAEIMLELSSMMWSDTKLWVLYGVVTAAIPLCFLLLIMIIWETKKQFNGVLGVALTESILPGVAILITTISIYLLARKKKMSLSEDFLIRIKTVLLISMVAMLGMLINLLLYSLNAEVVMDDLMDAIIKLGIVNSYIIVQPTHMASPFILSSLNVQETAMESSIQPIVLNNPPEPRPNSRKEPSVGSNRQLSYGQGQRMEMVH